MSINFATLRKITIPEGNVKKITDSSGNIIWEAPTPTAFLYSDGSMVFQSYDTPNSNKTVVATYTGWDTAKYLSRAQVPWYSDGNYVNIKSVTFVDKVTPVSTSFWFTEAKNMTSFDGDNLDTTNVTDMSWMFYGCEGLTMLDVSSFKTSNVNTMNRMFCSCKSLIALDVSNFNTSNVTDMSLMFNNCLNLTTLNVSSFNTSSVNTMTQLFYTCKNLTTLDISSFNTSNVTNMSSMFNSCMNLTTIYVSNSWSTASVTSSNYMFSSCYKLVGGNGTSVINKAVYDKTYALIDKAGQQGYLTYKAN